MIDRKSSSDELLLLVHGLLDERSAAALNHRITSEPQLARQYALTREEADLIAEAARLLETPDAPSTIGVHFEGEPGPPARIKSPQSKSAASTLKTPTPPAKSSAGSKQHPGDTLEVEPVPSGPVTATPQPPSTVLGWTVNTLLAAAALAAAAVCAYFFFTIAEETAPAGPRGASAELMVTAPPGVMPGVNDFFRVHLEPAGNPDNPQLRARFQLPSGRHAESEATLNENGKSWLRIPRALIDEAHRSRQISIQFAASGGETAEVRCPIVPDAYVMHVRTDSTVYAPGRPLQFRVLNLSRYTLRPPAGTRQLRLLVHMVGKDSPLLSRTVTATDGVAYGELPLPRDAGEGKYELLVDPGSGQAPASAAFQIQRPAIPGLMARLALVDPPNPLRPGMQVTARVSARWENGRPADDLIVRFHQAAQQQSFTRTAKEPGVYRAVMRIDKSANFQLHADVQLRGDGADGVDGARKQPDGDTPRPGSSPGEPDRGPAARGEPSNEPAPPRDNRHEPSGDDLPAKRSLRLSLRLPVAAEDGGATPIRVAAFPEGGSLVRGIPGRVYFRATHAGRPVKFAGGNISTAGGQASPGEKAASLQSLTGGFGYFTYRPDAAGRQVLSVDLHDGVARVYRSTFALPVAQFGASLTVDPAIFGPGEPLSARLQGRLRGANRRLLVAAVYRGLVVSQTSVATRSAAFEAPLQIHLPEEVSGMIRLVALDVTGSAPRPLSERLVYRRGDASLQVVPRGDRSAAIVQLNREFPVGLDVALQPADEMSPPRLHPLLLCESAGPRWIDASLIPATANTGEIERILAIDGWRQFKGGRESPSHGAALPPEYVGLSAPKARPSTTDRDADAGPASLPAARRPSREARLQMRHAGLISFISGAAVLVLTVAAMVFRLRGGSFVWIPCIVLSTICVCFGIIWMNRAYDESTPREPTLSRSVHLVGVDVSMPSAGEQFETVGEPGAQNGSREPDAEPLDRPHPPQPDDTPPQRADPPVDDAVPPDEKLPSRDAAPADGKQPTPEPGPGVLPWESAVDGTVDQFRWYAAPLQAAPRDARTALPVSLWRPDLARLQPRRRVEIPLDAPRLPENALRLTVAVFGRGAYVWQGRVLESKRPERHPDRNPDAAQPPVNGPAPPSGSGQ